MSLIRHSIVTYKIQVAEDQVRRALIEEAMDRHGLTHEGKPIPGLTSKVLFDGRRGNGVYTIEITRDLAKSEQARLTGPTS